MESTLPSEDWRPSPQENADGTYSCRIRILRAAEGMLMDGGFREALHYDHPSELEAEKCAVGQITGLRRERDEV
jgi:hypothetical protein